MEDVNDQTCLQYWIHWRPWLRYTVQGIQHCHFVSQNAVMLSSLAIVFKRSDQWWCLLAAVAPWSVGCIMVVTLGGKIFTLIRGCLKLVHSHLDKKGALYVGKTAFCSNPHCFSKARNSGGEKMLGGSVFKKPYPFMLVSVCVHWQEWDLFCHLWTSVVFFAFPIIGSQVFPRHMTTRCPLDIFCLGEHFAVLRMRGPAGMPFQCNPASSTLCSSSSCKFICALISEILYWTNVSAAAVNVTLHSVVWIPHHCLNLASCPKEALNSPYEKKTWLSVHSQTRDWRSFCSFLVECSKRGNIVWRPHTLVVWRSSGTITVYRTFHELHFVVRYVTYDL